MSVDVEKGKGSSPAAHRTGQGHGSGPSKLRKELAGLGYAEQQQRMAPGKGGADGTTPPIEAQPDALVDAPEDAGLALGGEQDGAEQSSHSEAGEAAVGAAVGTRAKTQGAVKAPRGHFQVEGQSFDTLDQVQEWLAANPPATEEPSVVTIKVAPGKSVMHVHKKTVWTYYDRRRTIVLDGNGSTVTGWTKDGEDPSKKRPTIGFFLSYRPVVGTDTTQDHPAPANIELKDITIKGFEAGGIEISPQMVAGDANKWDGGKSAFVEGASVHDCTFKGLGSKHTRPGEAVWNPADPEYPRYGAGGVIMRGVSNSVVADNRFEDLENGKVWNAVTNDWASGPDLIHAVYMRDSSTGNTVRGNDFVNVSGDPVRVSNGSHGNTVAGNTSENAGQNAMVADWHNTTGEVSSKKPKLKNNEVGTLYGQNKKGKEWFDIDKKRRQQAAR